MRMRRILRDGLIRWDYQPFLKREDITVLNLYMKTQGIMIRLRGTLEVEGQKHQFFLKMQSRCTKKQSRTLKVSTGMRWMKMELLTVLGTVMTETFIGMATHRRTVVSQYLLKSIKGSYPGKRITCVGGIRNEISHH